MRGAATPEDIPEQIDLSEDAHQAISRSLTRPAQNPHQLGQDIADTLRSPHMLEQAAAALQSQPILLESILGSICSGGRLWSTRKAYVAERTNGRQNQEPSLLEEAQKQILHHLQELDRTAADIHARQRIRRSMENAKNTPEQGRKRDHQAAREQRIAAREHARHGDLAPLARKMSPSAAASAADILIRENRIARLVASGRTPDEMLAAEMGWRWHCLDNSPAADLGSADIGLVAARLWKLEEDMSGRPARLSRWVNPRHMVLWVTGSDTEEPENWHRSSGGSTEHTGRILTLLPSRWLRVAIEHSGMSRRSVIYAVAAGDPKRAALAGRIVGSWAGGLEELKETCEAITS